MLRFCSNDHSMRSSIVPHHFRRPNKSSFGRINLIHPKRRFWKAEPTFQSALSKHFSAHRRRLTAAWVTGHDIIVWYRFNKKVEIRCIIPKAIHRSILQGCEWLDVGTYSNHQRSPTPTKWPFLSRKPTPNHSRSKSVDTKLSKWSSLTLDAHGAYHSKDSNFFPRQINL